MTKLRTIWWWCLMTLSITGIAFAQGDTCPTLVLEALDSVDLNCTSVGRNEACYGHAMLDANVVGDVSFETVGDIGAVADIQSLSLSALDLDTEQWGVALLQLQANIPNSLPGQNVTFIAYGNTSIENDTIDKAERDLSALLPEGVVDRPQVPVTPTTGQPLNVRSGPATTFAVIERLNAGDVVEAVGRTAEGAWLQIVLANGADGWVSNEFVSPSGDLEILPPATVDSNIVRDAVIEIGESVVGSLNDEDDEIVYTFVAEVGTTVGMEMNALDGDLDPVLRLLDAEGNVLAENDDFAGLNAAINAFVIPQSGAYTIVATRLLPSASTGQFQLSLGLNEGLNYFAPMQAFYFTSGIGAAECNEVPDDGIVMRTPSGVGEVRFLINEVVVELGSTIIARSNEGEMFLGVLEGRMRVEAFGVAQFVPAGFAVRVPMGERAASGPPSTPEVLDPSTVTNLDIIVGLLPDDDDIAEDSPLITPPDPNIDVARIGDLLVTLTWDNNADMDLFLTEPTGTTLSYRNPSSPTGAALNMDINEDCDQDSAPYVETITWPNGQARLGTYEILVSEYSLCGDGAANWTLTVEADGIVILEESGSGEASFNFQR